MVCCGHFAIAHDSILICFPKEKNETLRSLGYPCHLFCGHQTWPHSLPPHDLVGHCCTECLGCHFCSAQTEQCCHLPSHQLQSTWCPEMHLPSSRWWRLTSEICKVQRGGGYIRFKFCSWRANLSGPKFQWRMKLVLYAFTLIYFGAHISSKCSSIKLATITCSVMIDVAPKTSASFQPALLCHSTENHIVMFQWKLWTLSNWFCICFSCWCSGHPDFLFCSDIAGIKFLGWTIALFMQHNLTELCFLFDNAFFFSRTLSGTLVIKLCWKLFLLICWCIGDCEVIFQCPIIVTVVTRTCQYTNGQQTQSFLEFSFFYFCALETLYGLV